MILVGGIAWLVTRQVVTPVRMAARIAERLAAGRLEERMRVRGEDDLARLAASFNRMATSLQRQIRQLEDLSRVQRRFVSDVSHELRTPLTTVRMAADVLHEARQGFDPAVERSAEMLQTAAGPVRGAARRPAGDQPVRRRRGALEAEPTDLRGVARTGGRGDGAARRAQGHPAVARRAGRAVHRRGRQPADRADPAQPGRQRDRARRGPAGARHRRGGRARGRDRGPRPRHRAARRPTSAMVFNRFWRADPARARTTGGTGLGLSIALEDAHLHGGWLQAWGEPGDGSQFRLTVPRILGAELEGSPIPLEPSDSLRRTRPLTVGQPYRRIRTPGGVDV